MTIRSFLAATILYLASTSIASATLMLDWRNSNPAFVDGYQYRLVFVTSGTTVATSTDIATYNTFVQNAVANSGSSDLTALTGAWTVIGSTATTNVRVNTNTESGDPSTPFYLVNGTKVADNIVDLWDGNIDARINADELGNTSLDLLVHTGTNGNGTTDSARPLGGGGPDNTVRRGNTDNTIDGWIHANIFNPTVSAPIYAMSDVQTFSTATVPEPSSLMLFTIGIAGVAGWRFRRRLAGA